MIRRLVMRSAAILAIVAAAGALASSTAAQPERQYISGYAGTISKDPKDQAKIYFQQPAVLGLIQALEQGPLSVQTASARLAGAPASLDDLIRLKLVRRQGEEIHLSFAYFNAADMRLVHEVAARFAPSLVAAYRAKAPAFAKLWAEYPVASVDKAQVAFVLIAGMGLNWDGLDVLYDGGWRKPELVSGPGWRYSFFASEDTPDYSYRGYYWGSSAFPADLPDVAPMPLDFVSFGDLDSEPRMNLPDLMGTPATDMTPPVRAAAERLGFRDDPQAESKVLGVETGRQIGRLLLALREGPATATQLQAALPGDPVRAELQLLEATGYARAAPDGRVELTTPVFADADKAMFDQARALNQAIIRRWVTANYGPIRRQLAGLTALRQGVAYEALFTQIWHELFGLTTRELVAEKLVADPRAAGAATPGSLGMAWRHDILQRVWR